MTFDKPLLVNNSPHIVDNASSKRIMLDVIIALVPSVIAGAFFFGLKALLIVALSVVSAVLAEYLYNLARKKKQTVFDLSAVVTGLIFGLNLPPQAPLFIPIIGGAFAIIIVKMFFGGIGKNFANPAATARLFLLIAYSEFLASGFVAANTTFSGIFTYADFTAASTPLNGGEYSLLQLFLGARAGCIGETSMLAILIGGIYLVIRRVIDYTIPLSVLVSAAFFAFCFGGIGGVPAALMSGGLVFGAVFMATDYATSPKLPVSRLIYGFSIGLITMLIRYYGNFPEGMSIAIVFMNIIVPMLDKYILPLPFGCGKKNILYIVVLSAFALMALALIIAAIICVSGGGLV